MLLSTPSLLLTHCVSLLTVTLLLILFWLLRFPLRGPGWWTCAYITAIIGIILLSLRSILPVFLSIACGNILTLLSMVFIWNGIRRFLEKPGFSSRQWGIHILCLIATGSALYVFAAVVDIIQIRIVIYSLYLSVVMVLTLTDIRSGSKTYRTIRLISTLYIIYISILILRAVVLILLPIENPWESNYNNIFICFHNMAYIAIACCFMILISERLLNVVARQYNELEENMKFRKQMESLLYHDLKSPMLPVVYLPDILLQNETLTETGKGRLLQIKEAAQRIIGILNNALIAHKFEEKSETVDHDFVDILHVIHKAHADLDTLQKEKDLNVVLQTGPELDAPDAAVIQGDEGLLYRMYVNLLRNALQASPCSTEVPVRLERRQDRLRISIQNKGEVPQALRACFFEKYVRGEHSKGLGLGTYSAKLAVQAHGGRITLNTEEPGMTEVAVCLPMDQSRTAPAGSKQA